MKMNNKAGGIYEEGNDYSLLKRMDSEDYLKFDDIKDRMIICDGGYRFVAAVRGYGFDFYRSPAEVQAAVMQNFIGFINTRRRQRHPQARWDLRSESPWPNVPWLLP